MRRASLVGPLILIVIGAVFLVHNMWPELPILSALGQWWPAVLIVWGFLRVLEITTWKSQGRPLPQNGMSGGAWTFGQVRLAFPARFDRTHWSAYPRSRRSPSNARSAAS